MRKHFVPLRGWIPTVDYTSIGRIGHVYGVALQEPHAHNLNFPAALRILVQKSGILSDAQRWLVCLVIRKSLSHADQSTDIRMCRYQPHLPTQELAILFPEHPTSSQKALRHARQILVPVQQIHVGRRIPMVSRHPIAKTIVSVDNVAPLMLLQPHHAVSTKVTARAFRPVHSGRQATAVRPAGAHLPVAHARHVLIDHAPAIGQSSGRILR